MIRTRIQKTVRSAAATLAVLAMSAHISGGAQATPALVAYWDFDDTSNPQVTRDKLYGVEGALEGGAAFTTGRSGAPGDNALDFGTTSAGQVVRVTNVDFLNQAAADDQITISFWQNLYSIASTSAFWGVSPSSSGDQRGIQVHTPWGDNNIYYDTAGCCDGTTQRISGNVVDFEPNFGAGWHHITVIKNGSNKQIWINGNLFLDGNNTSPLPVDFVRLMIGGDLNAGNSLQGIMDDFAVFDGVLSADQIAALASGTAPDELSGIEIMTRPLVSAAMGTTTGFSIGITESPALPIDVKKKSAKKKKWKKKK